MSDVVPNPPPTRAVLEYATPQADGLPEWVDEAERIIDRRRPPREIRQCFRTPDDAVRYFGKSMSRRYSPDALLDRCAGCGRTRARYALQLVWSASCPPRAGEFRVSDKSVAQFRTIHSLCRDCLTDWTWRLRRLGRVRVWMSRAVTWVIPFWAIPWIALANPAVSRYVGAAAHDYVFASCCVAALAIFITHAVVYAAWRWRHPRKLQALMPRDVRLLGYSAIFWHENHALRSLTA